MFVRHIIQNQIGNGLFLASRNPVYSNLYNAENLVVTKFYHTHSVLSSFGRFFIIIPLKR